MRKIVVNIFISLAMTALLLGILELGTRIYLRVRSHDNIDIIGLAGPQDTYIAQTQQRLLRLIKRRNISQETFNIYYFGGSTMYGEPYAPQVSIPKLVEYMLGRRIGDKRIRSLFNAGPGQDFRWNLMHLKSIVKNRKTTHPSLCVIYAGNNEYLKYHGLWGFIAEPNLRLLDWLKEHSYLAGKLIDTFGPKNYPLEIDQRKYFDKPLFAQKKYEAVIRRYCRLLKEAVDLLHRHDIPVIICTPVGNYSDWEPNRSVFSGDEARKDAFKQLMDKAYKAEEENNFLQAVDLYQEALSLSKDFALAHYRLAQSYQALGEDEKAWDEYLKAVDDDKMPIRATSSQNDFIRKLKQYKNTYVADSVTYLREHAPRGLIGFNLMIDGHHPNLEGYILISELIAEKIKDVFCDASKKLNYLNQARAKELFGIDQSKEFEIYISRGRWFYRLATWRYDPSSRLKLSEDAFKKAMALDPKRPEPYLGLAIVNFLRNDVDEADRYLSQARAINAGWVRDYLAQDWIQYVIKRAMLSSSE